MKVQLLLFQCMIMTTNKQSILKIINGVSFGFSKVIINLFNKSIRSVSLTNEFIIEIELIEEWLYPIVILLKKHTLFLFSVLIDIAVYETLGSIYRFTLIYNFLSLKYTTRLFLKTKVREMNNNLLSIVSIFRNSNWIEREIYDFYGITFRLNKDLRRILLDYGFAGYPLRKDFPLTGFLEAFYDDSFKKISYETVELAQEYRNFFYPKNIW